MPQDRQICPYHFFELLLHESQRSKEDNMHKHFWVDFFSREVVGVKFRCLHVFFWVGGGSSLVGPRKHATRIPRKFGENGWMGILLRTPQPFYCKTRVECITRCLSLPEASLGAVFLESPKPWGWGSAPPFNPFRDSNYLEWGMTFRPILSVPQYRFKRTKTWNFF